MRRNTEDVVEERPFFVIHPPEAVQPAEVMFLSSKLPI